MTLDRSTPHGTTSPESETALQPTHAPDKSKESGSLARARALVETKAANDAKVQGYIACGLETAKLLSKLGMDVETQAVALLLPAVEVGALDTMAVKKWVGVEVARLTEGARRIAVLKDLSKTPTEAVQADRLRQMLLTIAEDPRAVLVSLAHQLYLLRAASDAPEPTQRTLGQQTLDVFVPLANRLGVWQLKQELEDLAFRYLEPDDYQRIAGWLDQQKVDRERYIGQVIGRLREEFKRAKLPAEISGRSKHIFGVWTKMRRKDLDISKIFDVLGFRILVNQVSDCYAALGVVQGLWDPVLDEFDDYIAKPKPNGYQSLHSAVIGPEGTTIEVQIRTFAMHRHAEMGVAAHWQYKEGGLQRRLAWSRGFLECDQVAAHGTDLIERFKQAAFHARIYVLTPQGHISDLPAGATPLDFAYTIHTDLGHRCRGAKVDGVMVSLTQPLANGQQVEILTARDGHPSRDWLNPKFGYLKTALARRKVRLWFKQQDHELHVAQGRTLLEREHRRLGLSEVNIAELTKRFKMKRPEDLLAALGSGAISMVQLGQALRGQLPPQPLGVVAPAPVKRSHPQGTLLVDGSSNVLTKIAGCCQPVPGEPIGGYITTQGRGVSIHRRDCANLQRLTAFRPDKRVVVTWSETSAQSNTEKKGGKQGAAGVSATARNPLI